MCCFTQEVDQVSDTNIFARLAGDDQYLVYAMSVSLKADTAMVLPVPVAHDINGADDDAEIQFINLEDYADFFEDMTGSFSGIVWASGSLEETGAFLAVKEVGQFEASYVPSLAAFARLDPRFRIDEKVWEQLPDYHDFGFAVFKLKSKASPQNIHPMAFRFKSRMPEAIYFPTLHIHDGDIHPYAGFDHQLFCQVTDEMRQDIEDRFDLSQWESSHRPASAFMRIKACQEIVDPELPCLRARLNGMLENKDAVLARDSLLPKPEIKPPVLTFSDVYVAKAAMSYKRLPLTELAIEDHIHGSMSFLPDGETRLPHYGYWGENDACVGEWLWVLNELSAQFSQASFTYPFPFADEDEPALTFELSVRDVVITIEAPGEKPITLTLDRATFEKAILEGIAQAHAMIESAAPETGKAWLAHGYKTGPDSRISGFGKCHHFFAEA